MSFAAVLTAIRERFADQVSTPNSLVVVHDNGPEPTSVTSSWCRFSVRFDPRFQVSQGETRYRTTGAATALFFGPIAKGDAAVTTLGDATIIAFQSVKLASPDLTFTPAPGFTGTADRDEAWIRRTVTIPFRFDEVVT